MTPLIWHNMHVLVSQEPPQTSALVRSDTEARADALALGRPGLRAASAVAHAMVPETGGNGVPDVAWLRGSCPGERPRL